MSDEVTFRWQCEQLVRSPAFTPLSDYYRDLANLSGWPGLSDYQYLFEQFSAITCNSNNTRLRFVAQDNEQRHFEDQYEPRIFLKGEVQTRLNNWHDFFQVLVWASFPATKFRLNALHYASAKTRQNTAQKIRTPLENALTLFDECGAIIVSTNQEDLDLIRQFDWHTLFWKQREQTIKRVRCFIFGHALYEKALIPYIGMTAHAILATVDKSFLSAPLQSQRALLDNRLVEHLSNERLFQSPSDLQPVPILGFPGWHAENNNETFYHNTNHFRPGRKDKKSPLNAK